VDDERTLTIPDYIGNNHFNTLGNLLESGRAGLLFIDFEGGHLLTLTGKAEILWETEDLQYFTGAERLWRFHLHSGRFIQHALPMRWDLDAFSPNSLMTGTWREADQKRRAQSGKHEWTRYQVTRTEYESDGIKSIYLAPESGVLLDFKPGQFLTLRARISAQEIVRTYSLSSAPEDSVYRVSVKRVLNPDASSPDGLFSNFLHDTIEAGDQLDALSPRGSFTYDAAETRPAVLLAAGVGITPMVSMMRHTFAEGFRTRSMRSLTLFAAARNAEARAFAQELAELQEQSRYRLRTFWSLGEVDRHLKVGTDYHHVGRISADLLQSVLPLDDYDFYVCGPAGFMQHCYDLLRDLGVQDKRIFAEAFGPSTLKREQDEATSPFVPEPVASEAVVHFHASAHEQVWTASDGTLLEFAEAHGYQPEFACRSGQCGACKVPLISGRVSYETACAYPVGDQEVLLCQAKPAADGSDMPTLSLDM